MITKEYLDLVGYTDNHEICGELIAVYKSKFDDSYITQVGMEDNVKYLAKREITEQLTHGVGFSPKDKKWYGWSHRAIYGFEIGSTCKKGDCHYIGSNLQEQEEAAIAFWDGENHVRTWSEGVIKEDGNEYFDVKWDYDDKVPNKALRKTIGGCLHYIKPCGRGEWVAKTFEDAKQMAVDFNDGVS